MNKVKNLKKTGSLIIKKVKITAIKHYGSSGNNNSRKFNGYYAEAKEGNIIYCSDAYKIGKIGGTPIQTLKDIYKYYGFEFDKNETHKQDVLRENYKRIAQKKFEYENGLFFKKVAAESRLFIMENERKIIEKGYEPEYREVNGKRITVGDTVNVYINPENEKFYWMDIDFLFDK